jgi:hypothetical protein
MLVVSMNWSLAAPHAAPAKSGRHTGEPVPQFSKTRHFSFASSILKGAVSSKELVQARKLIGKRGSFYGVVASIYLPKNGDGNFYIDFSKQWKNELSAAVSAKHAANFPNLKLLEHHKVLVSGTFSLYGGDHPEIVVTDPNQIHLLK